jgi:hypothetical protein
MCKLIWIQTKRITQIMIKYGRNRISFPFINFHGTHKNFIYNFYRSLHDPFEKIEYVLTTLSSIYVCMKWHFFSCRQYRRTSCWNVFNFLKWVLKTPRSKTPLYIAHKECHFMPRILKEKLSKCIQFSQMGLEDSIIKHIQRG